MAGSWRSWRQGRSAAATCGGAQSRVSRWNPCSPASVEVQPEAQAQVWADATAAQGNPLKVVGVQDDETTSCSSADAHSPASSAAVQAPMKVEQLAALSDEHGEQATQEVQSPTSSAVSQEWTKVDDNAFLSDEEDAEEATTAMSSASSLCTTSQLGSSPASDAVPSDEDMSWSVETGGLELSVGFANAIERMAEMAADPAEKSCFHAVRAATISMKDYMERIRMYFYCSDMCFVLAFVFLNRLITSQADDILTPLSAHRLVLTSMMIAAKFHDDVLYENSFYAKVGGVRTKEINSLEARFLILLDWRLQVGPEEYRFYRDLLLAAANPAQDSPQGLGPPGICG